MTVTEPATKTETELKDGKVVAIAGPVVDVEFPRGSLPEINQALQFTVELGGNEIEITAEVAQQIGEGRARERVAADRDLLPGGDVDHRGLQLRGQVGEARRSADLRNDVGNRPIVVLRHLRARRITGGKGNRRPASTRPARVGIPVSGFGSELV